MRMYTTFLLKKYKDHLISQQGGAFGIRQYFKIFLGLREEAALNGLLGHQICLSCFVDTVKVISIELASSALCKCLAI